MENDDTSNKGEVNNGGGDEKLVIGGVEMSPDEAKELVESGKTMKELRTQYPDIDFNEMPKAFTQTRQELAELKKPKVEPKSVDAEDEKRRKEIDSFFDDPYVQEKLEKKQAAKEQALREDLEFQKVIESLESELDGSDGRPKFDKVAVLKHGQEHRIFNPKTAYKDLHESALEEWAIKNALDKRRPTTFSERKGGTSGRQPDVKTPTSFREATEAALAAEE